MKLTVIGSLGGFPVDGKATSSFLLESKDFKMLIDCGSGALLSLQHVIYPLELDAVLLTHFHADHVADVGVLQHFWQLAPGHKKQKLLPIYASSSDKINFNSLDWPNATKKRSLDVENGMQIGPFKINFLKTKHPVETYALRIHEINNKHDLVYTSDTAMTEEIIKFSENADVLLADTNFFENKEGQKWHLTTKETATLANKAKINKVILTHLPPFKDSSELKQEVKSNLLSGKKVRIAKERMVEII